jgi:membrane protein implicated in regulation of membrane protease activity
MGIALITFCVVLLVTLILVWIWIGMRDRRRRLRNDDEPQLTTAAKHFVADMDSRARQGGARWQAPGQERASRQYYPPDAISLSASS